MLTSRQGHVVLLLGLALIFSGGVLFLSAGHLPTHVEFTSSTTPCSSATPVYGFQQNTIAMFGQLDSSSVTNYTSCAVPQGSPSVWYALNVTTNAQLTASTCNSYTNGPTSITFLESYTNGPCNNCTAFSTQNCSTTYGSSLSAPVTPGTWYIAVYTTNTSKAHQFQLEISTSTSTCSNSPQIDVTANNGAPRSILYNQRAQAVTPGVLNGCPAPALGEYVSWVELKVKEGSLALSTCNGNTETNVQIAVYNGTCNYLGCPLTSSAYPCGYASGSNITVEVKEAGHLYVGLFSDQPAQTYVLTVEETFVQMAPNSGCPAAIGPIQIPQAPLLVQGNTKGAPFTSSYPCSDLSSPSAWFQLRAPGNSRVSLSTCNELTSFDTRLSVYGGQCNSLYCVGQVDDSNCSYRATASTYNFTTTPGNSTDWYVAVTGFGGASGLFGLLMSAIPL